MLKDEVLRYLETLNPNVEGIIVDPGKFIFEENVKMNCFYCGKYNRNWRCPPNLPDLDYRKMMREYEYGLVVQIALEIRQQSDYDKIRTDSSVILHKLLLELEKWMYQHNSSNAISFIGGSCKLCKGGCGKDRCNHPYLSRTPLEGLGVNIIKSMKEYGVNISFPTDKVMKRVGLLLWQEP